MWISHEPVLYCNLSNQDKKKNEIFNSQLNCEFEALNTKGAYVLNIANNSDLVAIAINQKKIQNSLLTFFSLSSGKSKVVNLKNFGLNTSAHGR